MFGNFSEDARNAISTAIQNCRKFGIEEMSPLILLLGIVRAKAGSGIRILKGLQVEIKELEHTIINLLPTELQKSPDGKVAFAPQTKACFELAVLNARRLSHHPVGTEHLLLSLFTLNDDEINEVLKLHPVEVDILPAYIKSIWEERREFTWDRITEQLPTMANPELSAMLNRLDDDVQNLLEVAYTEAIQYNNSYLDVEHLVLALVKICHDRRIELPGVSLKNLDVFEVRQRVEDKIGLQSEMFGGEISFTIRAKKVLEVAVQEAYLNDDSRVRLSHVLVGLLGYEKGYAGEILMADLAAVRNEMLRRKVKSLATDFASIDVSRYKLDRDLLLLIPPDFAHKHLVLPLHHRQNYLTVAMAVPTDLNCLSELETLTKCTVIPVLAAEHWIKVLIDKYYPYRT